MGMPLALTIEMATPTVILTIGETRIKRERGAEILTTTAIFRRARVETILVFRIFNTTVAPVSCSITSPRKGGRVEKTTHFKIPLGGGFEMTPMLKLASNPRHMVGGISTTETIFRMAQ